MITTHYSSAPSPKFLKFDSDTYYDISTNSFRLIPDDIAFEEIDRIIERRAKMTLDEWFIIEEEDGSIVKSKNLPSEKKKKKKKDKENSLVENTVWFRDAEDVADETRDRRLKHISELELDIRKRIEMRIADAVQNTFTSVKLERSDLVRVGCWGTNDFKDNEIAALKMIKAELKTLGYKVTFRTKPRNEWNLKNPYFKVDWSKPKKRKGRL